MSPLTATAFEQLLDRFEGDEKLFPSAANSAEKYELLRQKLVKCLTWKGVSETDADALADTALDRVALKISQGEVIENIKAYACEVLRYVWLEYIKKHKELAVDDENMPVIAVEPNPEIFDEPDLRVRCLRKCLAEVVPEENDRLLIVGYYDLEAGDKIKNVRKDLAEKLGFTMINLKVKALRLRARLEKCINECVERLSVTKMPNSDTNKRGESV